MKPKFIIPQKWISNCIHWFLTLLLFFTFRFSSKSQCIASNVHNPGTIVNDNSTGSLAFSAGTLNNAMTSNDSWATATATIGLLTGTTNYLKATGFGFNIPALATICGVEVEIEKSATGISVLAWITDHRVRLVKGGTVTGNNLADEVTTWTGTDVNGNYGGETELWGTTLTPAEVNSSGFGVAISSSFSGVLGVFPSTRIDNIRMTVHYIPALPTHIISFSSRLKNNNVHLEWKTADEEDGEIITVQRKITGQAQWEDIARFDMHTGNTTKTYSYTDALSEKGNYAYRLRITNNNSVHIYSATKYVSYEGNTVLNAYPNPAGDYICIDNVKDPVSLSIRNLSMQAYKLPVVVTGNKSVKVDTRSLPAGLYFVSCGTQQIKFIKQ
jgi:hypothetical protein